MNMRVEGYDHLAAILQKAFDQSARGKGVVRHGDGKPWHEQDIITIGQKAGIGFNIGQAMKKLSEACGMLDRGEEQPALAEMLGAIVYTASAYYIVQGRDSLPVMAADPLETAPPEAPREYISRLTEK